MSHILYRGAVTLADAANIATDASLGEMFRVSIDGDRTLDNPTNLQAGMTLTWRVTNNAAGTSTLAYGSAFKFPGVGTPTFTAGPYAVDIITGKCFDGTRLECSCLQNVQDPYTAEVMADTPVAWWRCAEGSGTDMLDSSGNAFNGTYTAGIDLTHAANYVNKTAVRCKHNAIGGHHGSLADVPAALKFGINTQFTLEAWVYFITTGTALGSGAAVACMEGGGYNGYSLFVQADPVVQLHFSHDWFGAGGKIAVSGTSPTTLVGQWTHIVATYSGSGTAAGVTIYTNGASRAPTVGSDTLTETPDYTGHINVGSHSSTDSNWIMNGYVSEVAIYGTELSAARLLAHYNAMRVTLDPYAAEVLADSPLAWWRCDEGSGTTMRDSSGNGLHGTYTAGTDLTHVARDVAKTSLHATDTDSGGYHGSLSGVPASLRFGKFSAFSLESWSKFTKLGVHDGSGGTVSTCDSNNNYNGYVLMFQNATTLRFVIYGPALTSIDYGLDPAALGISLLDWNHVVSTYDGSGSVAGVKVYVNGVYRAPTATTDTLSGDPSYTINHANVGSAFNADNNWQSNAYIADAAIYGTELSAARVLAHYNAMK